MPCSDPECGLAVDRVLEDTEALEGCVETLNRLVTVLENERPIAHTLRSKVLEFHRAFRIPVGAVPHVPDDDRVRLRARLVAEEFLELLEALYPESLQSLANVSRDLSSIINNHRVGPVDIAETADACTDLVYVIEGTNLEFGIDSDAVLDEVHRTNMAKLHDGKVVVDGMGKVRKPPGWTPPDIAGVLARQK